MLLSKEKDVIISDASEPDSTEINNIKSVEIIQNTLNNNNKKK